MLVVDDQTLVRAGFVRLLETEPGIAVAGEAADGLEALEAARRTRPDVVLMDIRMPRLDGLQATARLTATQPGTRVVVLTTFDLDEYVFEAVRIGASGFLVKDTEPAELLRGVRAVAAGDALLSPGVTRRLIGEFATRSRPSAAPAADRLGELTEREREVVSLVGEGLNNDEIAHRLFLSPATAKTHVSRSMIKLHVRDRAQLVVLAYESGLVRPGWSQE